LAPSWFSGIFVALISLCLCIGTIVISHYQTSSIRVDFLTYQAGQITSSYHKVSNNLSSSSFFGNLPLLIFWSLVGLIVYLFVVNLFAAIRNTADLTSELKYVNADRRSLLWVSAEHLLVRLVVLGFWVFYIKFFFHHILPYCIAVSLVGSSQSNLLLGGGYTLLAVVVMWAALHVNVVLLRLLLLRPRIFSDSLYADID
jgi:hypothetical protein